MDGIKTKDGLLRAYTGFVLAKPYQDSSGMIVVQFGDSIRKATVVDVGDDVPPPLSPGDLIYFEDAVDLEVDILAVHHSLIVSFSRFVDEYA